MMDNINNEIYDAKIRQLKDIINDFVLVINLIIHGVVWDETDIVKAKRLVDYAQTICGFPKTTGDIAKDLNIEKYPETELDILRKENKRLMDILRNME